MARKPKSTVDSAKQVALFEEELAQYAENIAATEAASLGGGNRITLAGGVFKYHGEALPGDTISVVILDSVFENTAYGDYEPDNPLPPFCFALSRDVATNDDLVPHEKSHDAQADACRGCPLNEYGSAEKGRGKACKNTRRLALISEEDLDNLEAAEVAFMNLPVTSVKNWSGYTQRLRSVKRPPFAVVTNITIVRDDKTQFFLTFDVEEQLPMDTVRTLMDTVLPAAKESIMYTYDYPTEEEQAARSASKGSKKGGKKAATTTRKPRRKF